MNICSRTLGRGSELSNSPALRAVNLFVRLPGQWRSQPLPWRNPCAARSSSVLPLSTHVPARRSCRLTPTSCRWPTHIRSAIGGPHRALVLALPSLGCWHNRVWVRPTVKRCVTCSPCKCLTKSYTPESMVVFENKRNGELASAGSSDMAQPEPPPSNYTGQTYRLAAPRKAAGGGSTIRRKGRAARALPRGDRRALAFPIDRRRYACCAGAPLLRVVRPSR